MGRGLLDGEDDTFGEGLLHVVLKTAEELAQGVSIV